MPGGWRMLGWASASCLVILVTLTAPLAYALPVGTPANTVHRVAFTQDGVGGHTVTYGGSPVTVDLTAGASTTVELHPVGAGYAVRYPVANLDAQVSALAEDGGSALGASLSSTFGITLPAPTGTDDTAAIQAVLTAHAGKRITGRPGAAYVITAPLVIASGTTLDMTGASITSTHVGHMIRNTNYDDGSPRDTNIHLVGGTWQRNAGGVSSVPAFDGASNGSHSIFLRHVDDLSVRGLSVGSTGGKYMIALGDVTRFHVSDIDAGTVASDTVHLTGPASDGVVERVRVGSGGDDAVAITTKDYRAYSDTHGAVSAITIRDVTAGNATRAVLLGASAYGADDGHALTNITVENIRQTSTGAGVWLGSPTTTTPATAITMRNIAGRIELHHKTMGVVAVDNAGPVNIGPDAGGTAVALAHLTYTNPNCAAGQTGITINNAGVAVDTIVTGDGKFVGSSVLAALLGTIKHATIRNVQFAGSNHLVTLGGTIGVLDIESLSGTFAAGSHVVGLDKATSVIGTLNAVNCDYTAADTSSGILVSKTQPAATISAINVLGGRFTSIGRLLDTAIGSTGTIYMNVTGVHMSGCNRIAQVAGVTLDAFLNGVYLASMINEPIRVHVSGALTVRGSGVRGKSGSGVVRGASEVIQIFAPDFPADLSILTKANGAAATNTNAGLSCGLGPAISDGSTWKNLYSGTTY